MKQNKFMSLVLYVSVGILAFSSCNEKDDIITNGKQESNYTNIKDAVLVFSNKQDIMDAVNSKGKATTRAKILTQDQATGKEINCSKILSLTDKVQPDDPVLNEVSAEEKQIILDEGMTYYDMYGCEDFIPSENFAKLLNSDGEIQLNDSIYKITEFGTLQANKEHMDKLDLAYKTLKADTTIALRKENFIPVIKDVMLHPYNEIAYAESDTQPVTMTRATISDIPTGNFKHYSSGSKTLVGRFLSSIFGERSVKHHEFIRKHRVNGSLYSYDYIVYHETGSFVSMSKKRGGFFRHINGWKDINADELFMQYKGIVLELNLGVPQGYIPSAPINKQPEVVSYSDLKLQGFDHIYHNTVNIIGYNVKEKDLYKYIGQGSSQVFNILKRLLGNPQSLENKFGANGQVPAVRIITPDKVYVIIPDETYNPKNTKKFRKVFSSGVKLDITISNGSSLSDFMKSIQGSRNLPIKKIIGGEVLLAGKLNGTWGGMFIKKG